MSDPARTDPTRLALRHLGWVSLVFIALCGLTYVLPEVAKAAGMPEAADELERLKPWVPGERIPVATTLAEMGEKSLPAYAGAGGAYVPVADPDDADEASDHEADPNEATSDDPGNMGQPGASVQDIYRPPSGAMKHFKKAIENTSVLSGFFKKLDQTRKKKPGAITRIAHYGDSSIATDLITHTVRRKLQKQFGDSGHGFILIARGSMPYAHRDIMHRPNELWTLRQIVARQDSSGLYGYGGVSFQAQPGAYASFATRPEPPVGNTVSKFLVYYRQQPRGGDFTIRVDRDEKQVVSTQGEPDDAVKTVQVNDDEHRFDISHRRGLVELYGAALERDTPGVIYDSMGLVGARMNRLLNWNKKHLKRQLELRKPDLLILGFGGNEADDSLRKNQNREGEIRKVIQMFRKADPNLPCLLFAPLDQAERTKRGNYTTMKAIPHIVEAQKAAAAAEGCAFFNTYEAMGGQDSIVAWYRQRPRLALSDFRHATPEGYEKIADMFFAALMKAYEEYTKK